MAERREGGVGGSKEDLEVRLAELLPLQLRTFTLTSSTSDLLFLLH